MPMPPAMNTADRFRSSWSVNDPNGPSSCARAPTGIVASSRLNCESRIRVAIVSSVSRGALVSEKVCFRTSASGLDGSVSLTSTAWPAKNSKLAGLLKRNASVLSATDSRPLRITSCGGIVCSFEGTVRFPAPGGDSLCRMLDAREGRVVVNGLEVFRFDDERADPRLICQDRRHIPREIFCELWVVVSSLGDVLLVGTFEDTEELAGSAGLGDDDQLLDRHFATELDTNGYERA